MVKIHTYKVTSSENYIIALTLRNQRAVMVKTLN